MGWLGKQEAIRVLGVIYCSNVMTKLALMLMFRPIITWGVSQRFQLTCALCCVLRLLLPLLLLLSPPLLRLLLLRLASFSAAPGVAP